MRGSIGKAFLSRKRTGHFRSSILWLAILMIAVVFSLLAFFYLSFFRFAKNQALETTGTVTDAICTSISEMNSSIRNLCVAQFSGTDVRQLLHAQDSDDITIQQSIARLKRSASSTPDIHSIITYNLESGQFFSTHRGISDIDQAIKDILQPPFPEQLTPLPRVLDASDYYTALPVFSYIMYDSYGDEMSSALIVNINAAWLSNRLQSTAAPYETLLVFDENYHVLARSDGAIQDFSTSVPDYCRKLISQVSDSIETIDGAKYYVSVSKIDNTHWYLLREVPYDLMMTQSVTLEIQLLLFTIVIFILAIFFVFLIVRSIYRPIKDIATSIETHGLASDASRPDDDLSYISQTLQSIGKQYHSMQQTTSQMLQEMLLLALLNGRNPVLPEIEGAESTKQALQQDLEHCCMAILQVDNMDSYSAFSLEQKLQFRNAVEAAIMELLPVFPAYGGLNTAPGEFVILMQHFLLQEELSRALRNVQAVVQTRFHVSLSFFFESVSYAALPPHTRLVQLQKLSKYRLLFGPGCCLDAAILFTQDKLPLHSAEKHLANLRAALKRSDTKESVALFSQYCEAARNNNIENYRLCMMQLYSLLQALLDERSGYLVATQPIDLDSAYTTIINAQYSIQIHAALQEVIVRFCAMENSTDEKHTAMLESVREYIGLHYADTELSLKQIADSFHISQAYLGKLFREKYNISVKEYITEVRLHISSDYLKQSSISVKRVMELTGFDNESNFYRLFRSYFGTTPTNYRLGHSLEKVLSDSEPKDAASPGE